MSQIFIYTIGYFLLIVIIHIIIHRLLMLLGRASIKSVVVLGVGYILSLIIWLNNYVLIKFSDFLLMSIVYILLTSSYVLLIASPCLGDEGPSSRILMKVMRSPGSSQKEIENEFDDRLLINKRILEMKQSGLIKERTNIYYLTSKGKMFIGIIAIIRNILGWNLVG
jgi:hypothetical protein